MREIAASQDLITADKKDSQETGYPKGHPSPAARKMIEERGLETEQIEGTGPVKRRQFATKQLAVAQMRIMLDQTKAIWFQAMSEACANPSKDQLLRAWSAQYTTMENANEIAQLAIRTCGGQSMLKTFPLERMYRDTRCGSLMLPWTAELCQDMLGKGTLYERGESDE